jgi:hypothetical protein
LDFATWGRVAVADFDFAFLAAAGGEPFAFGDREIEPWAERGAFSFPFFFGPLPAIAGAAPARTSTATVTATAPLIAMFPLMHSRLVLSPTRNHHPDPASLT